MLYARCVGLAEDVAYLLNHPLPSSSPFYTPSTGLHQFPSPFQQKWKNEDVRNRGDQHQEQEKVNKFN